VVATRDGRTGVQVEGRERRPAGSPCGSSRPREGFELDRTPPFPWSASSRSSRFVFLTKN
jgi:hypothetical protein